METSIRKKLTEALHPQHLDVLNESYMHNVPKGSETHFKVVVISDKFENQPLIKVTNFQPCKYCHVFMQRRPRLPRVTETQNELQAFYFL